MKRLFDGEKFDRELMSVFYGVEKIKEELRMKAKKQAKKSKRIIAKRVDKNGFTVTSESACASPEVEVTTDVVGEATPPSGWLFYYQLEEAGLYVLKNVELYFVRVTQVDDGNGVKMFVNYEQTKGPVHPLIYSNGYFQKIKE